MAERQRRWSQDEVDWLIENTHQMSSSALADQLGRSVKSVQRKAEQLHLPIWRSELFGDGLRDIQGKVQIGKRRLLAKTCPKCGRFLMARRFFQRKSGSRQGHWYVDCIGCTSHAANQGRPDRDRGREARQKNQQASSRNAYAHYQPWTKEEDDIVRDVEQYPSVMECATKLGRTYQATQQRSYDLGVHRASFADVGKYWIIRFDRPLDPAHGIGARMEIEGDK